MSQMVKLTRVRVLGSIYLGDVTQVDGPARAEWSTDAASVMQWLSAGFRVRFNQHRSKRSRWLTCTDREGAATFVTSPSGERVLVPIGRTVTDVSDSQARRQYSFLSAVPAMVLQAPERIENREWFSAVARRKTNLASGQRPGRMPGFRRKDSDARFVCWFNGGSNAVFTKTGKRSATVTISGQNPGDRRSPDGTFRWKIVLHVRLSQAIRAYTSIRVNWTRREVVFVNMPTPVRDLASTGEAVGVDRGVVHFAADSNGAFYDAPNLSELERQRRRHQKRMAKSKMIAARERRQFWASARYQAHKTEAARLTAKQARIREDYAHKLSTHLMRSYSIIAVEDLRLSRMTRKGRGKGATAKRALNRSLANSAIARLGSLLGYKTALVDQGFIKVNPAYTSQRCHQCGYTAKENRKSQAVFRCASCSWTGNADTNAAINIRDDGLVLLAAISTEAGTTRLAGSKSETEPRKGPALRAASAMNRKPPAYA